MVTFRVTNYRYGLPKGSVVKEAEIDKDRERFLEPIVEVKSKKTTEDKE